jgi:hypothetical protein
MPLSVFCSSHLSFKVDLGLNKPSAVSTSVHASGAAAAGGALSRGFAGAFFGTTGFAFAGFASWGSVVGACGAAIGVGVSARVGGARVSAAGRGLTAVGAAAGLGFREVACRPEY